MATLSGRDESSELDADVESRSAMTLLRSVVLDLTHIVEDSTDLVSASLREEMERFRIDVTRQLFLVAAALTGAFLATAGIAMFVARWLESWPITLVIFGALYLGAAALIVMTRDQGERR